MTNVSIDVILQSYSNKMYLLFGLLPVVAFLEPRIMPTVDCIRGNMLFIPNGSMHIHNNGN